jgi:hypothetical protein
MILEQIWITFPPSSGQLQSLANFQEELFEIGRGRGAKIIILA